MELTNGQKAAARFLVDAKTYLDPKGWDYGLNFKPEPTDIILASGLKSGTTWVQQILQSLRSKGDMSFDEITSVFPELEVAYNYHPGALEKPQAHQPRMFKTHFEAHQCPKGAAKYIIVVREPADAAVSIYYHFNTWLYHNDSEDALEECLEYIYLRVNAPAPPNPRRSGAQLHHIASWYPHRLDANVLWIHYEDLKEDFPGMVRRIADFVNIGADDEKLQKIAIEQASYESMKKNASKYDDHVLKVVRNKALGLPEDLGLKNNEGKVRSGKINSGKAALSKDMIDKIYQRWREVVTPVSGYKTYEDMRVGINKELGRKLGSK